MTPRSRLLLAWLDVLAIPIFLAWYIWRLEFTVPNFWVIFPVWLVASWAIHRDTPKTLGWRGDNLWKATKRAAWVFAVCAALLVCQRKVEMSGFLPNRNVLQG